MEAARLLNELASGGKKLLATVVSGRMPSAQSVQVSHAFSSTVTSLPTAGTQTAGSSGVTKALKSAIWLQLLLTEAEGSGVEDSVNAKLLSAGLARFIEPRRNKVCVISKQEYLLTVYEISDIANTCMMP